MDTALRAKYKTKENCLNQVLKIANIVKSYNGDFVLLWHNSNLSVNEWEGWDSVYQKIVERI